MRTLLVHASLPHNFWHHALHMATYLLNILPGKTRAYNSPLQILYQKDPSFSHLRVFGCLCFPLYPSTTIHKLQPRSTPCVFLGYPPNHRGYKCYDFSSKKIIISRHVLFHEHHFPFASLNTSPAITYDFLHYDITPPQPTNIPLPPPTSSAGPCGLTPSIPFSHSPVADPSSLLGPSASGPQQPAHGLSPSSSGPARSAHGTHPSSGPSATGPTQSNSLSSPLSAPNTSIHPPSRPVTRSQHGIRKPNQNMPLFLMLTDLLFPITP